MASGFNKVVILGTLGSDPQVKYTNGGTAVCEFSMALNRQYFDKTTNQKKEECTWVPVTLWGRTAEVAGEYLSKGSSCLIEGRLEESSWQDKETGQKRSKLKVVGENMTMLGSPGGGNAGKQTRQTANESPAPGNEPTDFGSGGGDGDDVPF